MSYYIHHSIDNLCLCSQESGPCLHVQHSLKTLLKAHSRPPLTDGTSPLHLRYSPTKPLEFATCALASHPQATTASRGENGRLQFATRPHAGHPQASAASQGEKGRSRRHRRIPATSPCPSSSKVSCPSSSGVPRLGRNATGSTPPTPPDQGNAPPCSFHFLFNISVTLNDVFSCTWCLITIQTFSASGGGTDFHTFHLVVRVCVEYPKTCLFSKVCCLSFCLYKFIKIVQPFLNIIISTSPQRLLF